MLLLPILIAFFSSNLVSIIFVENWSAFFFVYGCVLCFLLWHELAWLVAWICHRWELSFWLLWSLQHCYWVGMPKLFSIIYNYTVGFHNLNEFNSNIDGDTKWTYICLSIYVFTGCKRCEWPNFQYLICALQKRNPFHFQSSIDSIEINRRAFGVCEMIEKKQITHGKLWKLSGAESIFRTSTPERKKFILSTEFSRMATDQAKVLSSKVFSFSFFCLPFVCLYVWCLKIIFAKPKLWVDIEIAIGLWILIESFSR